MLRKFAYTFAFLVCLTTSMQGQLSEKAKFFGGITYQFVGFTPLNSPQPSLYYLYGLGAGMDYVLLHSNDVVSLGINPNANLCLQFSYSSLNFLATVPTYMLARFGAGATPFNEQKFGIGAGIGGSGSYFASTSANGTLSTFFVNPSACVELAIGARGSNYLFRFNWSLMRPTREITVGTYTNSYRVGILGFSIFSTF